MIQNYIESSRKQFIYYKTLAEQTFMQLTEEQLFWKHNEASNSIAAIVKHLSGNMKSRWTDFLTTDGEKEWRNREAEFDNDLQNREELQQLWEEGWTCLFEALNAVNDENFHTVIYIRNQGHSIMEAINRQLAHYPYHIGQIVFIGKMLKGTEWASLSIPRGDSQKYNAEKFAQPQRQEHFTNEYLKKDKRKD